MADDALWFRRYWEAKGRKTFEEALGIIALLWREYPKQVQRRRYFEREYQLQSRRLHNMRRAYEKQVWQERGLRRACEKQLRQGRSMRHPYESQLRCQRSYYEQEEAPYGPTVAKLLALAVCSDSDGEAKAAFEKARALHRLVV